MKHSCVVLAYRKALAAGMRCALVVLAAAVFCSLVAQAQRPVAAAKELHVAAAADLQPILPTLAAEYEHATGVKIVASFGSSATLAQQLLNGDPQDLFLSADFLHPEQLIAAKLAVGLERPQAPTPYARGVLVLWARSDSPAQPLTLDAMLSTKVTRIAIANSIHAPYGFAATKALERLHFYEKVAPKLVVAENITQTAQFAESGNAQAAIISLTIASSAHFRALGSFVRFPAESYPEIRQCAVILSASKNQVAAQEFLRWLTSAAVQQRLTQFGLDPAN